MLGVRPGRFGVAEPRAGKSERSLRLPTAPRISLLPPCTLVPWLRPHGHSPRFGVLAKMESPTRRPARSSSDPIALVLSLGAGLTGTSQIGVLAKIESADSVEHLEEILDAVGGWVGGWVSGWVGGWVGRARKGGCV